MVDTISFPSGSVEFGGSPLGTAIAMVVFGVPVSAAVSAASGAVIGAARGKPIGEAALVGAGTGALAVVLMAVFGLAVSVVVQRNDRGMNVPRPQPPDDSQPPQYPQASWPPLPQTAPALTPQQQAAAQTVFDAQHQQVVQ